MARTQLVVVAFTDLVGSTELASKLGHDAFEAVRRRHFASLRTAAEAHGGTEVKNTGDGLMLRFGGAGDAIVAAAAMQQEVTRAAAGEQQPLAIRVGIAVGDASVIEGDIFGPPVVQAARLCAAAGSGQILATALLAGVAGPDAGESSPVGDLELKGLPAPVAAVEVAWEPPIVNAEAGQDTAGSHLVEVRPPGAPPVRALIDTTLEIGREGADVRVPDPRVSRRHLGLTAGPSGLTAEDLGSTNGTLLNGTKLSGPASVVVRDTLQIGDTIITVLPPVAGRVEVAPLAESTIGLDHKTLGQALSGVPTQIVLDESETP